MRYLSTTLGLLSIFYLTQSCVEDKEPPFDKPTPKGYIISNEGQFLKTSGTVSTINDTTVANKVFQAKNKREIGQVLQQAIAIKDGFVFIVNNAHKIQFTDKEFNSTGELTIHNPRHAIYANGQLWVTSWGKNPSSKENDQVYIIDPISKTKEDSVSVSYGAEYITLLGDYVIVSSNGGHAKNHMITRIHVQSKKTKEVAGAYFPSEFAQNSTKLYWHGSKSVIQSYKNAKGELVEYFASTAPYLILQLTVGATKVDTILTSDQAFSQNPLWIGDALYVVTSKDKTLHKVTNGTLSPIGQLSKDIKAIYATQVVDDKLFVFDAVDYVSPGKVYIYTLENKALKLLYTHTVGVNPSHALSF